MNNYVITIARGFGSGGKEIGSKIADRLGIPCYEKQILDMASEYSGINKQLFAEVDEKLRGNYITNWLKKAPTSRLVEPTERGFTSDVNLFNIQSEIIRELAKTQSCVIIGKCADYVLSDRPNVASFYIEAPRKECVRSIMNKLQVPEEKAHELIQKTDKYRADYYKYYTNGNYWTNPVNYDLTLNSVRVGRDRCVDVIEDYIKIKFKDCCIFKDEKSHLI